MKLKKKYKLQSRASPVFFLVIVYRDSAKSKKEDLENSFRKG
jgi:hypothetical protein